MRRFLIVAIAGFAAVTACTTPSELVDDERDIDATITAAISSTLEARSQINVLVETALAAT